MERPNLGPDYIGMSEEKKENPAADERPDEVELARKTMEDQDQQEELDRQIRENQLVNVSLTEADLHMFGDRIVLAQVTQLLSYIRHAVKNNLSAEIRLKLCSSENTVANAEFMFDVNGCQVPDCVTQPEWWIN